MKYTPLKVEIPDLQKPDSDPRQLRAFSSHEFSNVFLVFGPDQGPNGPDFTLSTEVAITIVNPPPTPTSLPTGTPTSTVMPTDTPSENYVFAYNIGTQEAPVPLSSNNIEYEIHLDDPGILPLRDEAGWLNGDNIYLKYFGTIPPKLLQTEIKHIYDPGLVIQYTGIGGSDITAFYSEFGPYNNYMGRYAIMSVGYFNRTSVPVDMWTQPSDTFNILQNSSNPDYYSQGYIFDTDHPFITFGVFYTEQTPYDFASADGLSVNDQSVKLKRAWIRVHLTLEDDSVITTNWLGQSVQLVASGSTKQSYPPGSPP